MKTILSLCVGLVACLIAAPAKADVIFSIDMDTAVAGIQNTRAVANNDSIQVALVMQLTGGTRVNAFSLGVGFDNQELTATAVDVTGRPGGFNQVNAATINNAFSPTVGRVRPFDALNVGGAIETNTTTVLGLITFTVTNVNDDTNDIFAQLQVGGIDDILDADTFAPIPVGQIVFNPGAVTVVPEPTTWLFGTVLAGFGARTLRKRFARKGEKAEESAA